MNADETLYRSVGVPGPACVTCGNAIATYGTTEPPECRPCFDGRMAEIDHLYAKMQDRLKNEGPWPVFVGDGR